MYAYPCKQRQWIMKYPPQSAKSSWSSRNSSSNLHIFLIGFKTYWRAFILDNSLHVFLLMICRSLLRSKCICQYKQALQQKVYALYTNKGFILFRPWLSRADIVMYLFHTQLSKIAPSFLSGQLLNRSFFKIESSLVEYNYYSSMVSIAALTSCPITASYHLESSPAYSHLILFTLSYPLVSLSPVFGCTSCVETKVSSLKHRFRNEVAFLLCWRT